MCILSSSLSLNLAKGQKGVLNIYLNFHIKYKFNQIWKIAEPKNIYNDINKLKESNSINIMTGFAHQLQDKRFKTRTSKGTQTLIKKHFGFAVKNF